MKDKILLVVFILCGVITISSELSKKYQTDKLCEINEWVVDHIAHNKPFPPKNKLRERFRGASYMKTDSGFRIRIPYGIFGQYSFWVETSGDYVRYGTY